MNEKGVAMNTRPLKKDLWIYRLVVTVLGLTVIACVVGAITLAMARLETPELLVALGSAAIGGLAGLLAPTPTGR
jgi:hypothetical protein